MGARKAHCTRTARSRTLHLVDLENLLGDRREEEVALSGLERYLQLARWTEGDAMLIAADPQIVRQVGFSPPAPCSLHATRGSDAADVMLLAHAAPELVARGYARMVIGSGDGIFVARARAVRDLGVGVAIVARPSGLARAFRRGAFPVVPFSVDGLTPPPDGSLDLAA